MPVVNGLQSRYEDQVDFFHIDWDEPDSDPVIAHFGVLRRSTYILIDPQGSVLAQWVGPLNLSAVAAQIDQALETLP